MVIMKAGKSTVRLIARLAIVVVVSWMVWTNSAVASGTDPTLALTGVSHFASSGGTNSIVVSGIFSFDDLVQFSFPAGLIVFQSDFFVVYDFTGPLTQGNDSAVTNGITVAEVPALLAGGIPAAAPAALLQLQSNQITAALPAGFAQGTVNVIIYAILEGDVFLSNTTTFTLP